MTQVEFLQQVENAVKLVESWPDWKQGILLESSSPTVPVPRKPVPIPQPISEFGNCFETRPKPGTSAEK